MSLFPLPPNLLLKTDIVSKTRIALNCFQNYSSHLKSQLSEDLSDYTYLSSILSTLVSTLKVCRNIGREGSRLDGGYIRGDIGGIGDDLISIRGLSRSGSPRGITERKRKRGAGNKSARIDTGGSIIQLGEFKKKLANGLDSKNTMNQLSGNKVTELLKTSSFVIGTQEPLSKQSKFINLPPSVAPKSPMGGLSSIISKITKHRPPPLHLNDSTGPQANTRILSPHHNLSGGGNPHSKAVIRTSTNDGAQTPSSQNRSLLTLSHHHRRAVDGNNGGGRTGNLLDSKLHTVAAQSRYADSARENPGGGMAAMANRGGGGGNLGAGDLRAGEWRMGDQAIPTLHSPLHRLVSLIPSSSLNALNAYSAVIQTDRNKHSRVVSGDGIFSRAGLGDAGKVKFSKER